MPEKTPPEHAPALFSALLDLRQSMGDTGTIIGVVFDLQRSTSRLLPVIIEELHRTRAAIDAVLMMIESKGVGHDQ